MLLDKIFGWKQLEARLADKDAEIGRLLEENKELRDRLFLKHQLPVSGADVTTPKAELIEGWLPKKARIKKVIESNTPLTAPALNESELAALREASQ